MRETILKVDRKGRIDLSSLIISDDITSFKVIIDKEDGAIILEPQVEISLPYTDYLDVKDIIDANERKHEPNIDEKELFREEDNTCPYYNKFLSGLESDYETLKNKCPRCTDNTNCSTYLNHICYGR